MSLNKEIAELLEKEPTFKGKFPNDVIPIRERKQYLQHLKDVEKTGPIKRLVGGNLIWLYTSLSGAAIRPGKHKGNPFVILLHPNKDKDIVVRHELGHYKDFKQKNIATVDELLAHLKKNRSKSISGSPETKERYRMELEAWKNAGYPKSHPIVSRALESYHAALAPLDYIKNKRLREKTKAANEEVVSYICAKLYS